VDDGGGGPERDGAHESAIGHAAHALEHAVEHAVEHALDVVLLHPTPATSRWHRAGISPRAERVFDVAAIVTLVLFLAGWTWSIVAVRGAANRRGVTEVTAAITTALSAGDAPTAAYLGDVALTFFAPLRGESGNLRVQIAQPGAPLATDTLAADTLLPSGAVVRYRSGVAAESARGAVAPQHSGVWELAVAVGNAIQPLQGFSVITLTPFEEKRAGRIGLYYIGNWPTEGRKAPSPKYAPPAGFIQVTPENEDTYVSEHFRLRDFLTKGQEDVWPKYLVLDTRLVDKLELVLSDLQEHGTNPAGVHVMSGFRTPHYNKTGGDPSGRAELSRHMYGDAADIFIDNDGDGRMDDLNHDGRVDVRDARVIEAAVDRVESAHPALVGGCGVYPGAPAHGPFTHIDTRGYRARWLGTGDS
jgi:hypothetical protein